MTTATLSRGSTSVTFDLWEESGSLLIAEDTGKPELEELPAGVTSPRIGDHFSAVRNLTVVGRLAGSSAYDDARVMAEELVKPQSGGTALQLDLSNVQGFGTNDVAPITDRALQLEYRPGVRNVVDLQMTMPVVHTTQSSASAPSVSSSSGSGLGNSIQLARDNTTVTIDPGLSVQRRVGRPNSEIQPAPGDQDVIYTDKNSAATDEFEISGTFVTNAESSESDLVDTIVRPPLARDSITLDFGGTWNLDSYDVYPVGSQAVRTTRLAGQGTDHIQVEKLALRTMTVT